MKDALVLVAVLAALSLWVSCRGSSVEEEATGAKLEVVLSNDLDNPPDAALKPVIINDGVYTPDLYIVGLRYLGLIRCLDAVGTEMACPGNRGEEIDHTLATGESMEVFMLNADLSTDQIIYWNEEGDVLTIYGNPYIGNFDEMETTPIDEAGSYSGLRMGIDFVMAAFPSYNGMYFPFGLRNLQFVFLCLNENGCSTLAGYEASYLGSLANVQSPKNTSTHVQLGDILFVSPIGLTIWHWWDLDFYSWSGWFSPLSSGRPANPLNQGIIVGDLVHGADGEWVYNASFGSTTPDGLAPLDITQELIDAEAADTLTLIFSVEDSMSFDDDNGSNTLDYFEYESLRFGKPRITEMSVSEETFQ